MTWLASGDAMVAGAVLGLAFVWPIFDPDRRWQALGLAMVAVGAAPWLAAIGLALSTGW